MAYTGNPSTVPRDAVRLEVGDIDADFPILADTDYDYFLSKNSDSIRRASVDVAKTILFKLSRNTHERIDQLEIWGDQWARNYMDALKLYIKDPNYSIATNSAMPYAGGISKTEIRKNIDNPDNQVVRIDRSLASKPSNSFVYVGNINEPSNPFEDDYIV